MSKPMTREEATEHLAKILKSTEYWGGGHTITPHTKDDHEVLRMAIAAMRREGELLAVCEGYLHLLDRPAPNPEGIWEELVTKPMRLAVARAKQSPQEHSADAKD